MELTESKRIYHFALKRGELEAIVVQDISNVAMWLQVHQLQQ